MGVGVGRVDGVPAARADAPPPTARGAAQAGAVAILLFQVCVRVDAAMDEFGLPDGYTARNVAVTLKTVARGVAYLLTFIYGANATGLAGLAVQLALYPEEGEGGEGEGEGGEGEGGEGGGEAGAPPPAPPPA